MNSASVQRVTSDTVEASVAGKLTAESGTKSAQLPGKPNELFFGDNLDILRRYVKDESVDLIYLDPPFNSGRDYNVLFEEKDGSKAAAQIRAFTDTWEWNSASALAFEETVALGGKVADALLAFRAFLGESDMLAYLSMMAPRLVELRRVLKEDGSLFLHCDPTSSHYLKMLLDAVFDPGCLRNEIDWCYTGPGSPGIRQYLRKHDVIFWYSKGNTWAFNADAVRVPHSMKTKANYKEGLIGSGFVGAEHVINPDGKVPEDWWQIAIAARGREYLGYPTQKPLALLERIIAASSDPGDVVLDPFCGCGTAVDAAQSLGRRWIGIDITHLAIGLIRSRLVDRYGADVLKSVRVVGEPTTIEDAEELAKNDPYQFQCWALGLVGARPAELKKGADRGIDGRLYFNDTGVAGAKAKQIIFSVKAGHVTSSFVRDLRGVLEREGAQIGVLLSFEEPTKPMRHEALSAGFYSSPLGQHQRIQLLTVKQLLSEHQVDYPWRAQASNVTYKHTVPAHSAVAEQPSLV